MDKISDKKPERSTTSKAAKPKPDVTSKIVSGVSKKSSTLTLVKSRQSSNGSRPTSKQSNVSRPDTSSSSTRFSRSSKLSIVDDKGQQQGVHQLRKVPSYLRGKRPVTAAGKLKATESETGRKLNVGDTEATKKYPNNTVGKQYGNNAHSKAVLDGIAKKAPLKKLNGPTAVKAPIREHAISKASPEMDPIESELKAGCPPCEGEGSGMVASQQEALLRKELELSELPGKIRHLEETFDRLDADCKQKQEQISELEALVAVKTTMLKERDDHIETLKQTVENFQLISTSRDSAFRDELQEVDHKMADLRRELSEKCNELVKSDGKVWILNERIEDLKAKLVQAGNALEEKEKLFIESVEKETEKDSMIDKLSKEIEGYRQHSETLTQRIDLLNQAIADKDAFISTLKTGDQKSPIAQTQLEAQKLLFESNILESVKQSDDMLIQVRSKLLEAVANSKQAHKARCDEMLGYGSGGETGSTNRTRAEGCDVLCPNLNAQQRQCGKEEQIISAIERNNQKCRAVRNRLLEMLRQLKKENRQMRAIIRNQSGQDVLSEVFENPTKDDSYLKNQLLNQICRLFPEEPVLQTQIMTQNYEQEEILNRINCDEIWSEENKTKDPESS